MVPYIEEQHRQRLRLFEAIADTTPDFLYAFDLDGRFVYEDGRFLTIDRDAALGELAAQLARAPSPDDVARRGLSEKLVPQLAAFYAGEGWRGAAQAPAAAAKA